MESHLCKLCLRTFPNGWALGGHMRSHSLSLQVPPRQGLWAGRSQDMHPESASSDSSDKKTEQFEGVTGLRLQNYGLRENPRRSIRVADPEFEADDYGDGSEMESSRNLTRRRSRRARKSFPPREQESTPPSEKEKLFWVKVGDSSEPASSISEESSEEDVAFCLMLLSRDRWKNETEIVNNRGEEKEFGDGDGDDYEDGTEKDGSFEGTSESEDGAEVKSESRKRANRDRGKYWCETCNKLFRSYQAFGWHRASHKKARLAILAARPERVAQQEESANDDDNNAGSGCNNKVHQCPYCDRVFSSGQALGGHKRSHGSRSNYYTATSSARERSGPIPTRGMIDLNMPAPAEDESSRV
ncbi:hypothetical protein MLD38_038506 [Melastoma candidum]|uniref:Uncharacterized protein n=1 Tax=Melastoma candidum TaxID=119954 RepID=A0ACB9L1F0_9MYRT|nr:hypothetical protein MLD38_038506 [Melastoma candidum]